MSPRKITAALKDIRRERDPNLKAQKLASLVCAVFRARGIELVVVGGSAIEFYTDGAYLSGAVDLCPLKPATPISLRLRQEIMGQLAARGGPRSWQVAGLFVDLLGPLEADARSPLRELAGPFGRVMLVSPEELLVERVLVAVYPQPNREARACARALAIVARRDQVQFEWKEVERLAKTRSGESLRLGLSVAPKAFGVDSAFRPWSASLALPDSPLLCSRLTSTPSRATLPWTARPLRWCESGVADGADLPR